MVAWLRAAAGSGPFLFLAIAERVPGRGGHCASTNRATALRENLARQPDNRVPDALSDLDYVRVYIETCERLKLASIYCLICGSTASSEPQPDWLLQLRELSEPLGFDVIYPSGSYSFVNGDYFAEGSEIRAFLDRNLNDNGLLDSMDQVETFTRMHQAGVDRGANWETLDDASGVMLWEDEELSGLRRILRSSG